MVKKSILMVILILNIGCLNMFRSEATYDGNSVSAESVKAETTYIEINSDKTEITTTQSAIITAKAYNKFDVYFKNTEVSFYLNGDKEYTTYTGNYEFEPDNTGEYSIYAKKGDITSSAIKITV
ncbi:MAG: hypothetical protein ACQERZ_09995, partial [Fusobacteriota bacterium]